MKLTLRQKAALVLLAAGTIAAAAILILDKAGILNGILVQPYRTLVRALVLMVISVGAAMLTVLPAKNSRGKNN